MLGVTGTGTAGVQTLSADTEAPEHLEILPGTGGTNSLLMSGLRVGSTYYVMAKTDITPNIDKPWRFLGKFTAASAEQIATILKAPNAPMEFYSLWRGSYTGPRLAIESPVSGAVVSGDVSIKVRVTDISAISLYAYVNGQPLASVNSVVNADLRSQVGVKHAGSPEIIIPAGVLRNGENHVSIVAQNHGVEVVPDTNSLGYGTTASFSAAADITIIASNEFAIMSNPAMASPSAGLSEHQVQTTQAGDVTLDIFDLDGTLCRSFSAAVNDAEGATVTFRWDYKDAGGSAYTNPACAARYTFTPTTTALASARPPGRPIWVTNIIDRSPLNSGSPLLTWMEMNETPLERALDTLCDHVFQNLYDYFSWAIPELYYSPSEIGINRTSPVKWKFYEQTMTNDVAWFHRFMKNTNFDSWIYHGHCNANALGFMTVGGQPSAAGTFVDAYGVSKDLGNSYQALSYRGAGYIQSPTKNCRDARLLFCKHQRQHKTQALSLWSPSGRMPQALLWESTKP